MKEGKSPSQPHWEAYKCNQENRLMTTMTTTLSMVPVEAVELVKKAMGLADKYKQHSSYDQQWKIPTTISQERANTQ